MSTDNTIRDSILKVDNLRKHFAVKQGLVFSKVTGWVKAVDRVSFTVEKGETFGLIGESGCGKTTTSRIILLLEQPTGGRIEFRGEDITKIRGRRLTAYRKQVQAVFQDPYSSLNPRMRVADIISEPIVATGSAAGLNVRHRVAELLDQVGLNPDACRLFPHEFSGGQRQRIAVARALAVNPQLIVLDEPVSALDVSIRSQLMNLLKGLQATLGLTYLLIAHDLAVMRHMCNRIAVMYLGKIVECGEVDDIYDRPLHPYTQALLSAALPADPDVIQDEIILSGEVPSALNPPSGCHFHPRCIHRESICSQVEPALNVMGDYHTVACHSSAKWGKGDQVAAESAGRLCSRPGVERAAGSSAGYAR